MTPHREHTRRIYLGSVPVGGGAPLSIQSMTNTDTRDADRTLDQIRLLENAGCDIIRVSIPDKESAAALSEIKKGSGIPVVADIHFDYRLAIAAIANGADGIRINPGNIGSREKVKAVAHAAVEAGIPVRIGVNLGSVKKSLLREFGNDHVGALVENAVQYARMLEDMGVTALKVSLKSSDVLETVEAYRRFSKLSDLPLHLGLTEAGTPFAGAIRSAAAMGALLMDGIGDTIRISLAGDPVQEITAGRVLLESVGLRREGVRVIACPTCARTMGDVATIASEVEDAVKGIRKHLVVAVMGCVVNGPGEAGIADLGVACDAGGAMLFVHGKPTRRIAASEITKCLMHEIEKELAK
jgi:(E)-4-hydroxy-3-methylbut-2-enyl-diphosphate synthase